MRIDVSADGFKRRDKPVEVALEPDRPVAYPHLFGPSGMLPRALPTWFGIADDGLLVVSCLAEAAASRLSQSGLTREAIPEVAVLWVDVATGGPRWADHGANLSSIPGSPPA